MTGAVDALEAIGSARAMRYLCPDPIPDEAVERLLWAATRASSAHNSQLGVRGAADERVRAEFGRSSALRRRPGTRFRRSPPPGATG